VDALLDTLASLAAPFCHQLPERSHAAGAQVGALCRRCTGFHLSFGLVFLALCLTRAGRQRSSMRLAAVAFVVLAGADGVAGWSGEGRAWTGALGGLGLAALAAPLQPSRRRDVPVPPGAMAFASLLAAALVAWVEGAPGAASVTVTSLLGVLGIGALLLGLVGVLAARIARR
jgi:uncharacterized membrane protein